MTSSFLTGGSSTRRDETSPWTAAVRGGCPRLGDGPTVPMLPPVDVGLDREPYVPPLLDRGTHGSPRDPVRVDGRRQIGPGPHAEDRQSRAESEDGGFSLPHGIERSREVEGDRKAPFLGSPTQER